MSIKPIKLFKDLWQSEFHSSVATTYSVDGAFYDGPVQRRLRRVECINNILIADVSMLSRALTATPETFALAGQRYAIVPAQVRGAFHPKILLRMGKQRARLLVGSANVTAAGWGRNLEVMACFDYRHGDKEGATAGPLVRKAYDYLHHWLDPAQGEAIAHKLRLHHRDSPWLADLEANGAAVKLPDKTAADLLCEFGDGKPGIMSRFVELVDGERVRQLVVVSPYWDDDLSALRNLREALGMPKTVIGLNPFVNAFPTKAVEKKDRTLRFTAVPAEKGKDRFLHAKVFVVSTDKTDHVVFGSANCTNAALGSVGRGGTNAEVSVYRRLSRGAALPMLGIDASREVEPEVFRLPTRDPFVGGSGKILAGQVEVTGRMVRWWPMPQVSGAGATLLIGSDEQKMDGSGSPFSALLGQPPTFPMVVRFRLANGRTTEPTVVHDSQRLLTSSPGLIDGKTLRMFQAVEAGRADFFDLAQRASQLFAIRPVHPRGGGGGGDQQEPDVDGTGPYATPEEFRAALDLSKAAGPAGLGPRFVTRDPTLLLLLRIVMRGIVDVPASGADLVKERLSEREEDERLLGGEEEDGDEEKPGPPDDEDDEAETPKASEPQEEPPTKKEVYTLEEIAKRRGYLMKALKKFDDLLKSIAEAEGIVDGSLIAQTAFVFSLMSLAVTMPHRLDDGSSRTLMTFEFTKDGKTSFAKRAACMLQDIWVGHGKVGPIASRIPSSPKSLPQDIKIFVVMSRWVMARAYGAVAKENRSLLAIIGRLAVQVFETTAGFASVDAAEEERLVRALDASVGFLPAETDGLLARMRDLRPGVPAVAPQTRAIAGGQAVAATARRS